jgi:hypothetical protein
MLVALFAVGCGLLSREDADVAPPPDPVPEAAQPDRELSYVRASRLRLREAPHPDAAWSPLAINTRVRVVGRDGEWVRIISPDGRTGFAHRDFLGTTPLTLADVQGELATAEDPAARVTWSERGAALAPTDPEMLKGLVQAYQGADRAEDAARIEEILRSGEADRFDRWFPAHEPEARAITDQLAAVTRAEDLLDLWRRARVLTLTMGEPLASLYDPDRGFVEGDPRTMLAERMPWAQLDLYAGGTQPALELAPEPWLEAAGRTEAAWDDAFFGLVTSAYQSASARGWARWQRQNWDYGGCSTFGNGDDLHLTLLKRTDALGVVPQVAAEVAHIRAAVLTDIEKPVPDDFPYCSEVGRPTPTEALIREGRAILADVQLTDEERARVDARVAERFGRAPGE